MIVNKRFTIVNMGLDGQFIKDNGNILTVDDVVDLLNEQHEEIERLRKENDELEKFRYAVFKNLHTITEKGDDDD